MTDHHQKYQVRYGAPWHHGERSRRYVVHKPPRLLSAWWQLTDPLSIRIERIQICVGLIFDYALSLFGVGLLIYLFFWHCLPVMLSFFASL